MVNEILFFGGLGVILGGRSVKKIYFLRKEFAQTNEERALFVLANPIEVVRRARMRRKVASYHRLTLSISDIFTLRFYKEKHTHIYSPFL